jgi:hypothetical protein
MEILTLEWINLPLYTSVDFCLSKGMNVCGLKQWPVKALDFTHLTGLLCLSGYYPASLQQSLTLNASGSFDILAVFSCSLHVC